MARFFYSCMFCLLMPLMFFRMWWRGRLAPAYRLRWGERLGLVPQRVGARGAIWVHSVSVGETIAALPMIEALLASYPDKDIIVTTTTPTGSDRVNASLGGRVIHAYAPYDLPLCLDQFIRRLRPDMLIIMETELWPNTIHACAVSDIPVVVANARLSHKSAQGYDKFSSLTRSMLEEVSMVAAQHESDGQRFLDLGLPRDRLVVTGSIKFDLTVNEQDVQRAQQFRRRWLASGERPVFLAASTHEGEDAKVLDAFTELLSHHMNLLLVLVPRHPERFDKVAHLVSEYGLTYQRHSTAQDVAATSQVLLGDTMGEMMPMLGASDIVFMGGSWVNVGGHNLIEPAAWGKPIISGPSLFNFAEVSRLLLAQNALWVADNPRDCSDHINRLLDSSEVAVAMGSAAKDVADANRGALQKLLDQIDQQLAR